MYILVIAYLFYYVTGHFHLVPIHFHLFKKRQVILVVDPVKIDLPDLECICWEELEETKEEKFKREVMLEAMISLIL